MNHVSGGNGTEFSLSILFACGATGRTKRFLDMASTSTAHAYVVMHAWENPLPDFKMMPRGFGDVLEMLYEIGAQLDRGILSAENAEYLGAIKGFNKNAKVAKSLLAQETSFDARECVLEILNNRVDRVKRWRELS